jgi:ubiquinone biosynthesis protein
MSDQMPQLISELPEIPMLLINALKEIESGSFKRENSKKQTEAIVSQLKENATKMRSAIFALVFIISAALLATQSAWVLTIASSAFGIIFWLKSR